MKISLDSYDKEILKILQQDASITNAELSKKINLSPSACLARTKNLRESGVIKQFTTILDNESIGIDIMAFATVNVSPLRKETMKEFVEIVKNMPEVMECHTLTGNATFLLKIVSPDVHSYCRFLLEQLMSIPCVGHTESNIVLETNKMNYALPVD